MPLIVCRSGCFIGADELRNRVPADDIRKIFTNLRIRIEKKIGMPLDMRLYTLENGVYTFPRRLIIILRQYGIDIDNRLSIGVAEQREWQYELTANQSAVADRLAQIFTPDRGNDGTACALLDMPPGQGKTILAAYIINRIGLRAAYIVHRRALAKQTVEEFEKVGLSAAIWPSIGTTTVIVINSINNVSDDFWQTIGTTVIDEVHAYMSPKRCQIFRVAASRYMLGMSGTICDRPDKPHAVYTKELCLDIKCEPIVATTLPDWIPDDLHFDCTVKAIRYYGRQEHTQHIVHDSTGMLFTPWMIKQFLADPDRQSLVLSEVRRLLADTKHTGIFVFCFERESLSTLRDLLAAENPYVPELSSLLIGGTRDPTAAMSARLILTTYGYSSTGISIQRMTAMVLYTPMRNGLEQISKRIMRRGGDMSVRREIVDIIDAKTALCRQFRTRKAVYERNGFDIVYETYKVDQEPIFEDELE